MRDHVLWQVVSDKLNNNKTSLWACKVVVLFLHHPHNSLVSQDEADRRKEKHIMVGVASEK
jgi:hypothetical protein